MTSQPDFVVVDDTSTTQPEQIRYSAGWTAQTFAESVGSTGPPLYQSLHVAVSQTNFTFTYNGAAGPLFVMGSILNDPLPTWNCTLDNKPMVSVSNGQTSVPTASNHIQLCLFDSQTTPVGDHTIRVSVAASENNPAYFDYILYTPAPVVRPGDLFFESKNIGIQYSGSGWRTDGNNGVATSNVGDTLDLVFNGHTVSWIGFYDGIQGNTPANATYSIDGATPVNFTIENTASGSTVLSEQVFFQTPSQGSGRHHLQVVYHGTIGSTPLALDHLIVQNSTADFELTPIPAVTVNAAQQTNTDGLSFQPTRVSTTATSSSGAKKGLSSPNIAPTTTLRFSPSVIHTPTTGPPSPSKPSYTAKVVGVCIGALGIVCVVVFLGCRLRRGRSQALQSSSELATRPFPDSNRPLPIPEKQRQQPSTIAFLDVERQSSATISSMRANKARRLVNVTTSALRRYRSHTRGNPPDLNDSSTTTVGRPSRIVMHQDSGVQLRQPDGEEVEIIEVPPAYASIK